MFSIMPISKTRVAGWKKDENEGSSPANNAPEQKRRRVNAKRLVGAGTNHRRTPRY